MRSAEKSQARRFDDGSGGRREIKLREVLSSPFRLRSESVERPDGTWIRVLSYPELGVSVEGNDMVDVLERIDIERIRTLLVACREDWLPDLPVAVRDPELERLLARAGYVHLLDQLDRAVSDLGK